MYSKGFETIRNNTALKRTVAVKLVDLGFETIRNNTALKLAEVVKQYDGVLKPFETTQL